MSRTAAREPEGAPGPGRGRGRTPLARRVRSTLVQATVGTALVAVLGYYCMLRASAAESTREGLLGLAHLGAAQLADLDLDTLNHDKLVAGQRVSGQERRARETFKSWSLGVMRQAQAVATALLSPHGEVVASWPPAAGIAKKFRPPAGDTAGFFYELPHGLGGILDTSLTVAIAPIDRGPAVLPTAYVCVVAPVRPPAVLFSAYFAVFVAVMVVAVAVITGMATSCLQGQVLDPLARLSRELVAAGRRRAARLPLERADELGMIARHLHGLCADLEAAHQHSNHMEQAINTAVTRETRHISRLLRRAEREAEIDPLTKLANRRFIEQRLEPLYEEQVTRGTNLVIVMFDVDNFKPLNDTEGHAAGDAILRFAGELLKGTLRDSDVGVRYGGDEFAIVLVDVAGREARDIAERIIRLFNQRVATMGAKTPVTLSAGVASLHDVQVTSGAELMRAADEALYESKRQGKNTVVEAR